MRRFRRELARFVIEALLIVVSVLAALAVNNWKTHREDRTRAAEARSAFVNEIEANRAMLASDDVAKHHRNLQAAYKRAVEARAPDPKAIFETGLHPATFEDAAWRSFSGSTIFSDFTVNEVLMLSGLYHAQSNIEFRDQAWLQGMTSARADRETAEYQRDAALSIWLFLNDLVPAEEDLVRKYDEALKQLRQPRY